MKVYIKNQQSLIKVNRQQIRADLSRMLESLGLYKAELSILLSDDLTMKRLNLQYRNIDKPTDVLSFPQMQAGGKEPPAGSQGFKIPCLILGDIVVNLQRADAQAEEHGLTFREELRWLLIHGLLHLAGYYHEENRYQAARMRKKEMELLHILS